MSHAKGQPLSDEELRVKVYADEVCFEWANWFKHWQTRPDDYYTWMVALLEERAPA